MKYLPWKKSVCNHLCDDMVGNCICLYMQNHNMTEYILQSSQVDIYIIYVKYVFEIFQFYVSIFAKYMYIFEKKIYCRLYTYIQMEKLNMPNILLIFVDNNVKHFIFCIYFDLHRRNSTTIAKTLFWKV